MAPPRFFQQPGSSSDLPVPTSSTLATPSLAGASTASVSSARPVKREESMARESAPPLVLSSALPVGESLRPSAAKTTMVPLLGRRGAAKLIFMKLILEPDDLEPGGYAATGLPLSTAKAKRRFGHHPGPAAAARRRIGQQRRHMPARLVALEQRRLSRRHAVHARGRAGQQRPLIPLPGDLAERPGREARRLEPIWRWLRRGGVSRNAPSIMVARLPLSPGRISISRSPPATREAISPASSQARCCGTSRSKRRKFRNTSGQASRMTTIAAGSSRCRRADNASTRAPIQSRASQVAATISSSDRWVL